ncbi:MAG: methyltransferase domain-containing protein [Candidatus Pacebacteria bacterium]|nr:methyltransferase domain-containing protein [Candidatus Paceibacterota bacterium]
MLRYLADEYDYRLVKRERAASAPATVSAAAPDLLAEKVNSSLRLQLRAVREEILRAQISSQWRVIDECRSLAVPSQSLACPLCGHRAPTEAFKAYSSHCIFGGGRLVRHQCPDCDVIFGPQKMLELTNEELSQEYATHYRVYEEGDSTELEIRAFHALNPRRDGVYLNYGAGAWSKSVGSLRSQGWNVFAYDPHVASPETEFSLDRSSLSNRKFDGIFSNNVLEHFRYPVNELKDIANHLEQGAKMSHATPCFEYLYEFTRFHLFFFLGRSRMLLARLAGLEVDMFSVDGEFMNIVLSRA